MTQKSYPQIPVPRLGFVVAVGLALGQVVYLALIYPALPESAPLYYDLQGQVLGLADKSLVSVFAVPAICLALIGGVWWCARYLGKQVAQDAAAPRHDAFSPHAARLKPREAALAERAGLAASVYSARKLYAQTAAAMPGFGLLAVSLAVMGVLLSSVLAGWGSPLAVTVAPLLPVGACALLTLTSLRAGKKFTQSLGG